MKYPILCTTILLSSLSLSAPLVQADDVVTTTDKTLEQERKRKQDSLKKDKESYEKKAKDSYTDKTRSAPQGQAYGSSLMTEEERKAFSEKMRSAGSAEQREQIRRDHHEEMTRRAQERGVTLPEEPPAKGQQGKKKGWDDDGTNPGKGQGVGKPKPKSDHKGKAY